MRRLTIALLLAAFSASSIATASEPAVGATAPEFGGTKFYNTTPGENQVTLAGLRGKVVLLDFWATWCHPCVASIPHLIALSQKYRDQGLVVIGHTDGTSTKLVPFITAKKIPYIISVGPNLGDAYGVQGIPHVVLIDAAGKVAWQGHPSELREETIVALLKQVAAK